MLLFYFSLSSTVFWRSSSIFFCLLSLFAWSLSSRSSRLPFSIIRRIKAFSSSFSPSTLALSTMLSRCWALLTSAFSSFSFNLASFWSAWSSSFCLRTFSFSLALFEVFLLLFENLNSEFFCFIFASVQEEFSTLKEEA